ncbi:hypothetical protein [Xenorhabdus ishibashii]|uniref:Uncharacterized protein n=1 Tax=Xenorhabdus ishibashii TaxID=1034471 RepID=A0A2D0KC67_9GAMM|nr:hypothetical protein [Xenorhabdus ishibashii]PHM60970.1 hypothetical protein Xish_00076 [Xenorhabdus ishibashii]
MKNIKINIKKFFLKLTISLLVFSIVNIIYAGTDKTQLNSITKEEPARLKSELINSSYGKNCTDKANYLGYVSSISIGYGGSNTADIQNRISITVMDKNRKNREWYWTLYDADTDAGKAIYTVAMYAAVSGEKISAQCSIGGGGGHYDIKSLWVGPDAW